MDHDFQIQVTLIQLLFSLTYGIHRDYYYAGTGEPPELTEGTTYAMYVWVKIGLRFVYPFLCVSTSCLQSIFLSNFSFINFLSLLALTILLSLGISVILNLPSQFIYLFLFLSFLLLLHLSYYFHSFFLFHLMNHVNLICSLQLKNQVAQLKLQLILLALGRHKYGFSVNLI